MIAGGRRPAESHNADHARSGAEQRGCACSESRASGDHIVYEYEVRTTKIYGSGLRHAERTRNVAAPLVWCQPRLCARNTHTFQHMAPHGEFPALRQGACEKLALIVASLALAHGCERHRNERPAFLDDIARPGEPRHTLGHPRRHGAPPAVLQRVHYRRARASRDPADRARRANEGREELAPLALLVVQWVAATLAARVVQLLETRPATAADGSFVTRVEETSARDAGAREEEIEERGAEPASYGADAGRRYGTTMLYPPVITAGLRTRTTVIPAKAGTDVRSG